MHDCLLTMKVFVCFWGETFCRIPWGSPFRFHPSASVEEKSKGILTSVMIIWNTEKKKESLWERRLDKCEQSVAHFCSCEGLCIHSDPDEGKCVIQTESTPLPQCRLLLTWRKYPAASRGSKEPWLFGQKKMFEVCVVNLKVICIPISLSYLTICKSLEIVRKKKGSQNQNKIYMGFGIIPIQNLFCHRGFCKLWEEVNVLFHFFKLALQEYLGMLDPWKFSNILDSMRS